MWPPWLTHSAAPSYMWNDVTLQTTKQPPWFDSEMSIALHEAQGLLREIHTLMRERERERELSLWRKERVDWRENEREVQVKREKEIWVWERERERETFVFSLTFFKIFTTMSLNIITQKLKLFWMCFQNIVFKHLKLRIITQTLLIKHSYQIHLFFFNTLKTIV